MDSFYFWLGTITPAALVVLVFATLLLVQDRTTGNADRSEPAAAAEKDHLHDQ
jgi:hypothetical protein